MNPIKQNTAKAKNSFFMSKVAVANSATANERYFVVPITETLIVISFETLSLAPAGMLMP